MTEKRLREIEEKWNRSDYLYREQLLVPLNDVEEHELAANEVQLFSAVKELIAEVRRLEDELYGWEYGV